MFAHNVTMARDDISWVRKDSNGEKLVVYAHQVRDRWDFFCRNRRHDDWEVLEEPLLEDWLEILDGVKRRANRRLYGLGEAAKLEKHIRKLFPREKF